MLPVTPATSLRAPPLVAFTRSFRALPFVCQSRHITCVIMCRTVPHSGHLGQQTVLSEQQVANKTINSGCLHCSFLYASQPIARCDDLQQTTCCYRFVMLAFAVSEYSPCLTARRILSAVPNWFIRTACIGTFHIRDVTCVMLMGTTI